MMRRAVLIVLDSVGIGETPDAARFGDAGSHTLRHTAEAVGGLRLPALEALGLGLIDPPLPGVGAPDRPLAAFGKMAEASGAKDTVTGHWELAGLVSVEGFPTFPSGFPAELIERFVAEARLPGVLGNVPASGTEIIERLGPLHLATGKPIVYTSADSVFQIAAHERLYPLPRLYEICEIARRLTRPLRVGRVIARPFAGEPGRFVRTAGRHDYALEPPGETLLDRLAAAGVPVVGIGKIRDIFAGRGISEHRPAPHNPEALAALAEVLATPPRAPAELVFANLVDFDMLYGHRNDPVGYAAALAEFDAALPGLLARLAPHDLLFITADHGCDPTTPSTDHSREYVPLLAYRPGRAGRPLGTRATFADLGATLAEAFGVGPLPAGRSFLAEAWA
ncbi:MAG TPA: phosphopentomutase [Thermodesulfobacteriota bacterium]|nr:phosphopentomutase [Thermodesulfobacteriota bacterium]